MKGKRKEEIKMKMANEEEAKKIKESDINEGEKRMREKKEVK